MMKKHLLLASVALPALVLVDPRPASACSFLANQDHVTDAAYASDTTPPSAVTASAQIRRWPNDGNSCFDIAKIDIAASATDDAAPADRLGYQVSLVSGELPAGLTLPTNALRVADAQALQLFFDYRDRDGFDIELELRAVDLNGNVGAPTIVQITETPDDIPDDGGGCSTGGGAAPGAALALLGLAATLRRRRR